MKLPPNAFAIGPKTEPEPSDLVDPNTWNSLVSLPDDVSLRTSEHYGSVLKKFWYAWDEWICLVLALQGAVKKPSTSPIAHSANTAIDEVQASIYNALVGFYRLAFSSLRNILEQMTIGLHLELAHNQEIFSDWLNGDPELKFGWAADNVTHHPSIQKLESCLTPMIYDNLFQQKSPKKKAGLARRLFSELSQFTHGGPAFTNGDLWDGSNGPIFVPKAFEKWSVTFAKTYALGVLEAKLAQPKITVLGSGSRLTVRDLFKQIVNGIPQKEDAFIALHEVLNLDEVWT
jgi:hypothetical protein